MNHHHRPTTIHPAWCECTECAPPVPSVAEPTLLATIAEMIACVAFGILNAWIVAQLIDGPGIHVMIGLPA
ncbi:hypothetical protein [Sphingomonas sp. VNH70]|uniref:hypothetical protein n=1 Tax=Sphingomonas silueang TaxID=3156617 RepID=UPI0032B3103E